VHELGSDSAIHTTANGSDNATFRTANFANASNFLADELFLSIRKASSSVRETIKAQSAADKVTKDAYHSPMGFALANIQYELPNNFFSSRRVGHLRMELDAVNGLAIVCEGGIRGSISVTNYVEIGRGFG
jgi:hypothetical protein